MRTTELRLFEECVAYDKPQILISEGDCLIKCGFGKPITAGVGRVCQVVVMKGENARVFVTSIRLNLNGAIVPAATQTRPPVP